jgi:hypothetical protein
MTLSLQYIIIEQPACHQQVLKYKAMEISPEVKISWKEEKANLRNEILSLQKSMVDYQTARKSEWKSFKVKFYDDLDKIEKSFRKLANHHRK